MSDSDPFDDDEEYELEPVDPEILEMERERIREKARQAELAVDINEAYEDDLHEDPFSLDSLQGFRFTTRHLLILTAIVAVILTIMQTGNCMVFFIIAASAVAAGWFYVIRKERQVTRERQRERAKRRRQLHQEHVGNVDYSEFDEPQEATAPGTEFRFSFSMRELLGAMTVAAITFALLRLVGGEYLALLLGMIALLGLIVHVIGFELPAVFILCWWLVLVLYVIVSIIAILTPGDDAAAAVGVVSEVMQC